MTYSTEVASFARPVNEIMSIHKWHARSLNNIIILYCLLVMVGFCTKCHVRRTSCLVLNQVKMDS